MQYANYCGKTDLDISDTSFYKCNFSQLQPFSGINWVGNQIFKDNTPRIFIECNLCNVEPPSGSLVQDCLTIIKRFGVPVSGQLYDITYGFWNPVIKDYTYFDSPKQYFVGSGI